MQNTLNNLKLYSKSYFLLFFVVASLIIGACSQDKTSPSPILPPENPTPPIVIPKGVVVNSPKYQPHQSANPINSVSNLTVTWTVNGFEKNGNVASNYIFISENAILVTNSRPKALIHSAKVTSVIAKSQKFSYSNIQPIDSITSKKEIFSELKTYYIRVLSVEKLANGSHNTNASKIIPFTVSKAIKPVLQTEIANYVNVVNPISPIAGFFAPFSYKVTVPVATLPKNFARKRTITLSPRRFDVAAAGYKSQVADVPLIATIPFSFASAGTGTAAVLKSMQNLLLMKKFIKEGKAPISFQATLENYKPYSAANKIVGLNTNYSDIKSAVTTTIGGVLPFTFKAQKLNASFLTSKSSAIKNGDFVEVALSFEGISSWMYSMYKMPKPQVAKEELKAYSNYIYYCEKTTSSSSCKNSPTPTQLASWNKVEVPLSDKTFKYFGSSDPASSMPSYPALSNFVSSNSAIANKMKIKFGSEYIWMVQTLSFSPSGGLPQSDFSSPAIFTGGFDPSSVAALKTPTLATSHRLVSSNENNNIGAFIEFKFTSWIEDAAKNKANIIPFVSKDNGKTYQRFLGVVTPNEKNKTIIVSNLQSPFNYFFKFQVIPNKLGIAEYGNSKLTDFVNSPLHLVLEKPVVASLAVNSHVFENDVTTNASRIQINLSKWKTGGEKTSYLVSYKKDSYGEVYHYNYPLILNPLNASIIVTNLAPFHEYSFSVKSFSTYKEIGNMVYSNSEFSSYSSKIRLKKTFIAPKILTAVVKKHSSKSGTGNGNGEIVLTLDKFEYLKNGLAYKISSQKDAKGDFEELLTYKTNLASKSFTITNLDSPHSYKFKVFISADKATPPTHYENSPKSVESSSLQVKLALLQPKITKVISMSDGESAKIVLETWKAGDADTLYKVTYSNDTTKNLFVPAAKIITDKFNKSIFVSNLTTTKKYQFKVAVFTTPAAKDKYFESAPSIESKVVDIKVITRVKLATPTFIAKNGFIASNYQEGRKGAYAQFLFASKPKPITLGAEAADLADVAYEVHYKKDDATEWAKFATATRMTAAVSWDKVNATNVIVTNIHTPHKYAFKVRLVPTKAGEDKYENSDFSIEKSSFIKTIFGKPSTLTVVQTKLFDVADGVTNTSKYTITLGKAKIGDDKTAIKLQIHSSDTSPTTIGEADYKDFTNFSVNADKKTIIATNLVPLKYHTFRVKIIPTKAGKDYYVASPYSDKSTSVLLQFQLHEFQSVSAKLLTHFLEGGTLEKGMGSSLEISLTPIKKMQKQLKFYDMLFQKKMVSNRFLLKVSADSTKDVLLPSGDKHILDPEESESATVRKVILSNIAVGTYKAEVQIVPAPSYKAHFATADKATEAAADVQIKTKFPTPIIASAIATHATEVGGAYGSVKLTLSAKHTDKSKYEVYIKSNIDSSGNLSDYVKYSEITVTKGSDSRTASEDSIEVRLFTNTDYKFKVQLVVASTSDTAYEPSDFAETKAVAVKSKLQDVTISSIETTHATEDSPYGSVKLKLNVKRSIPEWKTYEVHINSNGSSADTFTKYDASSFTIANGTSLRTANDIITVSLITNKNYKFKVKLVPVKGHEKRYVASDLGAEKESGNLLQALRNVEISSAIVFLSNQGGMSPGIQLSLKKSLEVESLAYAIEYKKHSGAHPQQMEATYSAVPKNSINKTQAITHTPEDNDGVATLTGGGKIYITNIATNMGYMFRVKPWIAGKPLTTSVFDMGKDFTNRGYIAPTYTNEYAKKLPVKLRFATPAISKSSFVQEGTKGILNFTLDKPLHKYAAVKVTFGDDATLADATKVSNIIGTNQVPTYYTEPSTSFMARAAGDVDRKVAMFVTNKTGESTTTVMVSNIFSMSKTMYFKVQIVVAVPGAHNDATLTFLKKGYEDGVETAISSAAQATAAEARREEGSYRGSGFKSGYRSEDRGVQENNEADANKEKGFSGRGNGFYKRGE